MAGPPPEIDAVPGDPMGRSSIDVQALARLVDSFNIKPDQKFLKKIAADAAEVIGADMVLINRLNSYTKRMRALEIYDRGNVVSEYVYELAGTPCEQVVLQRGVCCFPKGVQDSFPADSDLVDMGFEGYVGVPLFASDGQVMGLFCTLFKTEITNPEFVATTLKLFSTRIASEIERSEAEERTKLALKGGAAGIWDWDIESDDIYFTPELLTRIGMSRDKVPTKGSRWVDATHRDDREAVSNAFRAHISNYERLDINCRVEVTDGVYRWVRLTGEAQRDADGRVVRLPGTIADIDDLVRAQHEAEAANESKSAFLANMSHEIRTPMNAIMGVLQVLSGSEVTVEQKDWIDMAYGAASSLLTVLNDILDLSRLEAGKVDIVKEPFELKSVMAEIDSVFRILAIEKSLGFEVSISEDVPAQINTDMGRMRQILANYISNAIKFTDLGKIKVHVDVTNTRGFEAIEFSVQDTGVGISPIVREKLFERFEQGDMSTTRRYGGTGLGLAICRELATMLDGVVGVESSEGAGSRFWLALPIRAAEELPDEEAADTPGSFDALSSDTPLAGVRVLVAEDDIVNQRILKLLLAAFGAEVTVASTGQSALDRVLHQEFDVVLMDVSMPGLSGYDTTKAIRALEGPASQVPIVAVTAHAMSGDSDKALASGMNGYLPKPVAAETLIDEILKVLPNRKPKKSMAG